MTALNLTPRPVLLQQLADVRQAKAVAVERERRILAALGIDTTPQRIVPKNAARCGTESGYKKHRRNREEACADCRRAIAEAESLRRARRVARQDAEREELRREKAERDAAHEARTGGYL